MGTKIGKLFLASLLATFFSGSLYEILADSSSKPLVYSNNLIYLGAFRVVSDAVNTGAGVFSSGGAVMTYNPINNSLFIVGHDQYQTVAEISIPTPVKSSLFSNLSTAKVLQKFADITDGRMNNIGAGGSVYPSTVKIGGLLVYNNRLIGSVYSFYDGSGLTKLSHFTSSLNLSSTDDFTGMYQVGTSPDTPSASYVSGFMTKIPIELQSALGGPALTGNGTLSVLSRTSYGPAAFSFNPDRLGVDNLVSATPLLYYPQGNETLSLGYGSNGSNEGPFFGRTTKIAGMMMFPESRSLLFFGYHGIGTYNYGDWTADPAAAKPGGPYYDPTGQGSKGPHAYPYIYQVWAYDTNDLIHVKNKDTIGAERSPNIHPSCATGTMYQPYCIMPYAIWKLPFDFAPTNAFGGAAAFDPITQTLYISEPGADTGFAYNKLPLIHAFKLDLNAKPNLSYKIGGQAILLKGTVILKNNGGDDLTISASDRKTTQAFYFATPVAPGSAYNITISSQPDNQNCSIYNGIGTINANSDISNIVLTCNNAPKTPLNVRGTVIK